MAFFKKLKSPSSSMGNGLLFKNIWFFACKTLIFMLNSYISFNLFLAYTK